MKMFNKQELEALSEGCHELYVKLTRLTYPEASVKYEGMATVFITKRAVATRSRPAGEIVSLNIKAPGVSWADYSYSSFDKDGTLSAEDYEAKIFDWSKCECGSETFQWKDRGAGSVSEPYSSPTDGDYIIDPRYQAKECVCAKCNDEWPVPPLNKKLYDDVSAIVEELGLPMYDPNSYFEGVGVVIDLYLPDTIRVYVEQREPDPKCSFDHNGLDVFVRQIERAILAKNTAELFPYFVHYKPAECEEQRPIGGVTVCVPKAGKTSSLAVSFLP